MIKTYEPLHHKYRPASFDELVGQSPIASTLKQALISDRISPAYIFSGPRGTGKTSSARIFAKSLNCLKSKKATTAPCGECELCKEINSGTALDVIEIDAASNTGVENIRELIERSRFAPAKARWKVYVIDECHMLSTAAFNALLKTLEEPPPQVVFILATTDPQRVLPTILSRCMRFDFRRISLNDLTNHLEKIAEKEKIQINQEAILLIAKHSQGGLRDAESLLDQLSLLEPPITITKVDNLMGAIPEEELLELAKSLTNKDPNSILSICCKLVENGKEPISILQGIASILRDLVVMKVAPYQTNLCNFSQENSEGLKKLANSVDLDLMLELQEKLKGSEIQIRNSNQPKLWLEIQLLGMLSKAESETNKIKKVNLTNAKKENNSNNKNITHEFPQEASKNTQKLVPEKLKKEEESTESEYQHLNQVWKKVLAMLELPSTKMLLSQQAKLINLHSDSAEIAISEKWINMIQSRKNLIEDAFYKATGSSRKIILLQQREQLNNKEKKEVDSIQKNKKPEVKANHEKTNTGSEIKKNRQVNNDLDNHSIDNKAKQFADFFNGEIVNLE